jgi:hypothetical protein
LDVRFCDVQLALFNAVLQWDHFNG